MAALNTDTRLIMTILFVGVVSGANVFFYAQYGTTFPYTHLAHGVLFGLITVGAILIMKALNDLFLNDYIEQGLLDRRIEAYWKLKNKEEQQRKRMQDSLKTFQTDFNTSRVPEINTDYNAEEGIGNDFLATLQ
tara:strand:+ start:727 stop:1128 length:402 start_codon:yes stop_codon:yes gene_type:complete